MSSSLIFTNCLFCGFASLLILPLLRNPNIIAYKRRLPIWGAVVLVSLKLLIPYEFSFTHTLASKKILPAIRSIEKHGIYKNITIGNIFLFIWILIATILITVVIFKYLKLMHILSIIPETQNIELLQITSQLCERKNIKNKPKIIHLNLNTSPFIVGLRNPVIVLPIYELTKDEIIFILSHELEHHKHRHLLLKQFLEIITAIYWWNPFIWLMRKEIIRALEMQTDTYVMQGLNSQNSRLTYLESLLQLSKNNLKKQDYNPSLSFSLKSCMVEYRVKKALKYNCLFRKKVPLYYLCLFATSGVLLLSSCLYTFESYKLNPEDVAGTFAINSKKDYLKLREDGSYDFYVDGKYTMTIPSIPEDLRNITIYE